MKKILVPTDFSEYSEYALKVAATIARQQDADLVVVHMLGLSEAVISKDESREVMEALYYMKLAEKRFDEYLDKPFLEGLNIHTTVQNYKVFSELGGVAEEFNADLIVMGSHGSSGWDEVFVGSNTEKVVRTASVPVLVVKHDQANFTMDKVVFACDFRSESIPALAKARALCKTMGAQLQLLYVHLPAEQFRSTAEVQERIETFFAKAGWNEPSLMDGIAFYSDYTVEDGLFSYSNKVGADVIGIPTHGRKGLAHFFSGSIGEDVVNHSDIPVITFKI
ncbi:MAG: universal stress protein UspA [Flavobacteriaceae bacterium]|nr:universal stress protein UspA [Flavobacteriaceae bacterium]